MSSDYGISATPKVKRTGWIYVKSTYSAIAIWMLLFIWGGREAIREPFILGKTAADVVTFLIPAIVTIIIFVLGMRIRSKNIRAGVSMPRISRVKWIGAGFVFLSILFFSLFITAYLGVAYCLAYVGETLPVTSLTQQAELISERGLKPYSGDLALAHVNLLDEHRLADFAWQKKSIRNLMACPGGRISISGSGTVFGTVVQSVQCSPTPS